MSVKNLKSKRLKECEGENLYLNLEDMDVYCVFPYPEDGVTFRTKIIEIVLDGDMVNPDDVLNDEDLENIVDQVKTVIVTESEKKKPKKFFGQRLSETHQRTKGKKLSEMLKEVYSKKR